MTEPTDDEFKQAREWQKEHGEEFWQDDVETERRAYAHGLAANRLRSFDVPEKPIHWMEVGPAVGKMRKLPAMLFETVEEYERAAEILRRSR